MPGSRSRWSPTARCIDLLLALSSSPIVLTDARPTALLALSPSLSDCAHLPPLTSSCPLPSLAAPTLVCLLRRPLAAALCSLFLRIRSLCKEFGGDSICEYNWLYGASARSAKRTASARHGRLDGAGSPGALMFTRNYIHTHTIVRSTLRGGHTGSCSERGRGDPGEPAPYVRAEIYLLSD